MNVIAFTIIVVLLSEGGLLVSLVKALYGVDLSVIYARAGVAFLLIHMAALVILLTLLAQKGVL